jgi:hypothetical protein
MSELEFRIKLRDYIGRMNRDLSIDSEMVCGAIDYMKTEFADMEMENVRSRSGNQRTSWKETIKNILLSILTQKWARVKGWVK